jgi:hypothetical protein
MGILDDLTACAKLFPLLTKCSLSSHAGEQDFEELLFRVVVVRRRWICVEPIWISVGFNWAFSAVLVA